MNKINQVNDSKRGGEPRAADAAPGCRTCSCGTVPHSDMGLRLTQQEYDGAPGLQAGSPRFRYLGNADGVTC